MTLVDSSSWIEFLRSRDSEPGMRAKALLNDGEAAWCELTIVELWNGARGQAEKAALTELEKEVRLFPIGEQVWAQANGLARRCREKGVTVQTVDLVVAACAAHYDLDLEHCDHHFERVLPLAKK